MAISWLLTLVRLDNKAAVDTKNIITQGAEVAPGARMGGGGGRRAATGIEEIVNRVSSGVSRGKIYAAVLDNSGTLATGNIACTQANAAGDNVTFTYGGVAIVLTEGVHFARGATNTTLAAALAAAINAHPVLGQFFVALGAVGNCGLTARFPTALPHDVALTTNDGTAFAFTQMNGGTEGAAQFWLQNWTANST
jgi:phage tail sheath gpL-like